MPTPRTTATDGQPAAGSPSRTTPTLRRDAARNRARIIECAHEAFTTQGLEVSLDAVARSAGVGAGTLYRHFPAREHLVAAVLADHRPDIALEAAEIRATETDPHAALEHWLAALSELMRAYQGLPSPLREAVDATGTPLGTACQELIQTTESFLAPARAAGHARPEVDARQLFLAVLGMTWASTSSSDDAGGAGETDPTPGALDLLRAGWATGT